MEDTIEMVKGEDVQVVPNEPKKVALWKSRGYSLVVDPPQPKLPEDHGIRSLFTNGED